MSEKPIFIKGPLEDLSDVLRIARVQGRIILKTQRVKVKPQVYLYNDGYLVVVEPDGSGCSEDSDVGGRKETKK